MYLKLLRLEAKLTSRIFLPLMGAVMALSGLAMAAVQLAGPDALIITGGPLDTGSAPHNRLVSTLCGLLALGAFLSMVGLMITAVVVTIQRFYKNLLGDEGYLMFALPATPAQHLAAKLTVSVGWTFASLVLVLALTAALVGSIPVTLPDGQTPLRLMLSALHQGIPVPLWQWYGIGALTFLAGVCNSYLMLYLSMILGTRLSVGRTGSRVGRCVLIYVALRILVSSLSGAAASLSGIAAFETGFDPLSSLTEASLFLTASAGAVLVLLIGCLVWFFVSRSLLERRLDLA